MPSITVIKNDVKYDLTFTVKQKSGIALDLTGATIKFKVSSWNTPSILKIDGVCTVYGAPANGICKYTVLLGNFDTLGLFKGELEITYASTGKIITSNKIQITVEEELG